MATDSDRPIENYLARYAPFDSIDPKLLSLLAADITVLSAEPGFHLFAAGDFDAAEYYLLRGSIRLIARDGREKTIDAADPGARFPIARLRPRMYSARADSAIRYFVISAAVLDELQQNLRRSSSTTAIVEEMQKEAGEEQHSLLFEFEQELHSGRFVLPSLPEVALRIREMIESQDFSIAELARVVNTDPAIATKLVRVANSVMYRGVSNCDDTQAAISRLGLITTKQLVTSFAILSLFRTGSASLKQRMRELWQESIEVAAYSYVLARNLPRFNEEEALLAGLIHNIGEVVVLMYSERFYDLSTDSDQLEHAIASLRGTIGEKVLQEWEFSPELIAVARDAGNWMRDTDEDSFDYCDLVQIARLYALQGNEGNPSLPDMHSVPAFNKLKNRQLDADQTSEMIREAQLQIEELRQIFT